MGISDCMLKLLLVCLASSCTKAAGTGDTRYLRELEQESKYVMKDRDETDPRGAIETRIVNGVEAERGRFNYFVRLYGTNQCGGALIAPDVAITNAHCGEGRIANGALSQYNVNDNGQQGVAFRRIVQEVMHPDYGIDPVTGKYQYDLMLVKFNRVATKPRLQLNFNDNVPAASGEDLYMLGFGQTAFTGDNSDVLLGAPTKYIDNEDCLDLLCEGTCPQSAFPDDFICTKLNDPLPTRHCFGDSGGPIIKLGASASEDVLVGVIQSSESDCGEAETVKPDENQRITHSLEWILEVGCELSEDPPESWNCDGGVSAEPVPTPNPTVDPTPNPTVDPTADPSSSPTPGPSPPPTPSPTTAPPTVAPVTTTPPPSTSAVLESTAVPSLEPSTSAPTAITMVNVYVEIEFDTTPEETGWFIADDQYDHFRVGIPKGAYRPIWGYDPNSGVREQISLIAGKRYMFTIEDDDGLCCGEDLDSCCSNSGSYKIVSEEDEVLLEGDGEFISTNTEMFTVPFPAR